MKRMKTFLYAIALTALPLYAQAATTTETKETSEKTSTAPAVDTSKLSNFKVNYSLKKDGREWKRISSDSVMQNLASDEKSEPDNVLFRVQKFILAKEANPEDPSEFFVLERLTINAGDEAGSDSEFLEAFYKGFIEEIEKEAPNVKFENKIVSKDSNSLLAEWSTTSPARHGWFRAIKQGHNVAVLMFITSNVKNIDETRKKWEAILKDAAISDDVDTDDTSEDASSKK